MANTRFVVTYRIRCDRTAIMARAETIAVEQSVEMPVSAITDADILREIVGEVLAIEQRDDATFDARIGLAVATTGLEAGQFLNMMFGNTSLHDDVTVLDVEFPPELASAFPGPRHGIAGLRRRAGAQGRALTCSALKPQGVSSGRLATLARQFAQGGIDFVKDDHGLADQPYSPFAERIAAIAGTLGRTRYVPSLSGDLDSLRRQAEIALAHGIDTVMLAPMVTGWASMQTLVRQYPQLAFFAHPSMGGAARIAPPLLIGKLFRMLGADAVIFPNHGGRFGYTPQTCRALADAARAPYHGMNPSMPVPAGGMTLERVPEMLDFYGADAMLLIGGSLLAARERLTEATAGFVGAVGQHSYSKSDR